MSYITRGDIWNDRLSNCIFSKYTSQDAFAKAFRKKYKDKIKCTQKDVSRWLRVGNATKTKRNGHEVSSTIGFPQYNHMIRIAEFFDVSVGYLTGETDYDFFELEKASNYLGLNQDSIRNIKKITAHNNAFSSVRMLSMESAKILNKLFTSKEFFFFIQSLQDLDYVYSGPDKEKKLWEQAEQKLGNELLTEALEHRDDCIEGGDPEPSEQLAEAVKLVNDILDQCYCISEEKDNASDLYRYRLQQSFNDLINDMYPR
jgi:hypothetical protein